MPGNVDAGGPVRANAPVAPAGAQTGDAVQADAGAPTGAVQADAPVASDGANPGVQADAPVVSDGANPGVQTDDLTSFLNGYDGGYIDGFLCGDLNGYPEGFLDGVQIGYRDGFREGARYGYQANDQVNDQVNDQADQAGNKPMKKRRRVGKNELRSLGLPVDGTSQDQSSTSTENNREKRMAAVVTMSMRPSVYKDASSPSSSEASSSSEKPSLKFPSSTDDSSPSLPSDDSSSPPSSDEDGLRAARLVVMRITGDLPYGEFEGARAALRMVCEADGHWDYSATSSGNTSDDVVSPWTGSDGDMSHLTGSGESLDDYIGILPVPTDEGGDSPREPQYDGDLESAWPNTDDSAEDADFFKN